MAIVNLQLFKNIIIFDDEDDFSDNSKGSTRSSVLTAELIDTSDEDESALEVIT